MEKFEKKLTTTDASVRLSVPGKYLDDHFFELAPGKKSREFVAVDADNEGQCWIFRLSIRPKGHRKPVIDGGWMTFVRDKNVRVDDTVEFSKEFYHNQATATQMMRHRVKVTKIFYDFLGTEPCTDGLGSDDLTLVSRG